MVPLKEHIPGQFNLITFVRRSVWDVHEDRKSLIELLREFEGGSSPSQINALKGGYYNSKILLDAEHIKVFVDETLAAYPSYQKDNP